MAGENKRTHKLVVSINYTDERESHCNMRSCCGLAVEPEQSLFCFTRRRRRAQERRLRWNLDKEKNKKGGQKGLIVVKLVHECWFNDQPQHEHHRRKRESSCQNKCCHDTFLQSPDMLKLFFPFPFSILCWDNAYGLVSFRYKNCSVRLRIRWFGNKARNLPMSCSNDVL